MVEVEKSKKIKMIIAETGSLQLKLKIEYYNLFRKGY